MYPYFPLFFSLTVRLTLTTSSSFLLSQGYPRVLMEGDALGDLERKPPQQITREKGARVLTGGNKGTKGKAWRPANHVQLPLNEQDVALAQFVEEGRSGKEMIPKNDWPGYVMREERRELAPCSLRCVVSYICIAKSG